MKCKSCGAEIAENNKFCGICGAPNIVSDQVQNSEERIGLNNTADENKEYQIDDILKNYEHKTEETVSTEEDTGESANNDGAEDDRDAGFSEAAEQATDRNAAKERQSSDNLKQQRDNIPQNNYQGANPQYNVPPNAPYGNYPQNGYYNSFGGYPQGPAFIPPYNQNNAMPSDSTDNKKKKKEKKVISFGIAVFCVIVVLILSALCGYLLETCFRNSVNPFALGKTSSIVQVAGTQIEGDCPNG